LIHPTTSSPFCYSDFLGNVALTSPSRRFTSLLSCYRSVHTDYWVTVAYSYDTMVSLTVRSLRSAVLAVRCYANTFAYVDTNLSSNFQY